MRAHHHAEVVVHRPQARVEHPMRALRQSEAVGQLVVARLRPRLDVRGVHDARSIGREAPVAGERAGVEIVVHHPNLKTRAAPLAFPVGQRFGQHLIRVAGWASDHHAEKLEQRRLLHFGEVMGNQYEPGLHPKIPVRQHSEKLGLEFDDHAAFRRLGRTHIGCKGLPKSLGFEMIKRQA